MSIDKRDAEWSEWARVRVKKNWRRKRKRSTKKQLENKHQCFSFDSWQARGNNHWSISFLFSSHRHQSETNDRWAGSLSNNSRQSMARSLFSFSDSLSEWQIRGVNWATRGKRDFSERVDVPEHQPLTVFTIGFSTDHFPCFANNSCIIRRQCFRFNFRLSTTHRLKLMLDDCIFSIGLSISIAICLFTSSNLSSLRMRMRTAAKTTENEEKKTLSNWHSSVVMVLLLLLFCRKRERERERERRRESHVVWPMIEYWHGKIWKRKMWRDADQTSGKRRTSSSCCCCRKIEVLSMRRRR